MTMVVVALAVLLAAEFVVAPINLWSGRTIAVYRRYTGLPIWFAQWVLAPLKAATAMALLVGLAWRTTSVVGAAASTAVCVFYLVRLARPGGREGTGVVAFGLFGALSLALLLLQLSR